MDKRVFVVSHTHWDREWYFTRAAFQMMNVDMMQHLLTLLEQRPDYAPFLLDGQLVALEDYLEVCPDQAERIRSLVKEGRLQVGPWYVLPDEYLASGEAHIRNYLEGMRVAESLGGGLRVGYLPDSFGHPSQIPQILSGLGLKEIVFWRGTGPEVRHLEFFWLGKDGSSILALNMLYGYSNAANLKPDKAVRHRRLDHETGKLMDLSGLNLALLMNGSDHIAPDARVPDWIHDYQAERPGMRITHSALSDYVAEAHRRAQGQPLQQVSGELRSGYRAYLLGDTLSTRMPLKQRQREAEALLERHLEPLFVLLAKNGLCAYPADKLRHLWRLSLQNLPHDSICGCGSDPIHQEMALRYRQIQDIGSHLMNTARKALKPEETYDGMDGEIAVFQPGLSRRNTLIRVRLQQVLHPLRQVDYEQDQKLMEYEGDSTFRWPDSVLLKDAQGRELRGLVEPVGIEDTIESNLMTQPVMNRVASFDCVFADAPAPLAVSRYGYTLVHSAQPETRQEGLENEFYCLVAQKDGSLSLFHKAKGRWYHGLARLVDVADVGDEYTFDGLQDDPGVTMAEDSVGIRYEAHRVIIQGSLALPKEAAESRRARSPETVACALEITASLLPGLERVDVQLRFDNRAKDHRLMAAFPLGARADEVLSDSVFAVERRPLIRSLDPDAYKGWMEQPNNSFFMKNFAALASPEGGLAVFVRGLPQGEAHSAETGDALRLTLLRCVGWLSRKDLQSRDGNGGWTVATPEAQLPGPQEFHFSLHPFTRAEPGDLYAMAVDFAAGPVALQTARHGASLLPDTDSLLTCPDPRLQLSALKRAQDGRGDILRLINMSGEEVSARLALSQPADAVLTNLAEEDLQPLGQGLLDIPVKARPWQLVTCRLLWN